MCHPPRPLAKTLIGSTRPIYQADVRMLVFTTIYNPIERAFARLTASALRRTPWEEPKGGRHELQTFDGTRAGAHGRGRLCCALPCRDIQIRVSERCALH